MKPSNFSFLLFLIAVATFSLSACSDDSSSSSSNTIDSASESDFAFNVETLDDLPNCTAKHEQDTAFIQENNKIYVCEDRRWEYLYSIIDSVATIDDLLTCTEKREGDKTFVESEKATLICSDGKWTLLDTEETNPESSGSISPSSSSDGRKEETLSSSSAALSSSSSAKAESSSGMEESSSAVVASSSSEAAPSSSAASSVSSSANEKSSSSVIIPESSSSHVPSSSSEAILSSSSDEISSSSAAPSSSSLAKANWQYLNPEISYSEMTDSRDGQIYKTVKIGYQTWMAENLNYPYSENTAKSYCYNNSTDSCAKYGRLYLWSAAMDSAARFSTTGKGCGYKATCNPSGAVRGVCPEGWHLPSGSELETLRTFTGATNNVTTKALNSITGWTNGGTDDFGFSALPAGYSSFNDIGVFYMYAGQYANFWSSSAFDESDAYFMYSSPSSVSFGYTYKIQGHSVRCLKD